MAWFHNFILWRLDQTRAAAHDKAMARLKIRIDIGQDALIGPGKVELLETIQKTGSIRSAAAAMKMSYRRAWILLQETQMIMGAPVIDAKTGGARGGGAVLTETGRALVSHYRRIEKLAAKSAAVDLRALTRIAGRGKSKKKKT
jgi:molybdate transport system regulatory protein